VLNILLHTAYGLSVAHYSPTLPDLALAIAVLPKYGLPLHTHLAPQAPLTAALLAHASTSPIDVYTLAAQYDLYHLAAAVSPQLLSFPLPSLTDDQCTRMGPIYLKRLFFLHLGRTDALKRLLLTPPRQHAPTAGCDATSQKSVTRAWALASAYLVLEARPDMGVGTVEAALGSLCERVGCGECRQGLVERVGEVVGMWGGVRSTI
jgi:hypothetical protein